MNDRTLKKSPEGNIIGRRLSDNTCWPHMEEFETGTATATLRSLFDAQGSLPDLLSLAAHCEGVRAQAQYAAAVQRRLEKKSHWTQKLGRIFSTDPDETALIKEKKEWEAELDAQIAAHLLPGEKAPMQQMVLDDLSALAVEINARAADIHARCRAYAMMTDPNFTTDRAQNYTQKLRDEVMEPLGLFDCELGSIPFRDRGATQKFATSYRWEPTRLEGFNFELVARPYFITPSELDRVEMQAEGYIESLDPDSSIAAIADNPYDVPFDK